MNKHYLPKPRSKSMTFFLFIVSLNFILTGSLWAKPVVIMPLGDSITSGYDASIPISERNGYRKYLWELLTESGYDIDFVGSLESGTFPDKQHEGHGGWTDAQIEADIDTFLDAANPPAVDIILLHIGTNNISNAIDQGSSYTNPDTVNLILDRIDQWENANNKTIIVIVARIINRWGYVCTDPPTLSMTTTFNDNVQDIILNRINDRVLTIDMECGAGFEYDGSDMVSEVDEVHPNQAGYEKMADKWFVDGLLECFTTC